MKQKVIERVAARQGYLVKLECGHKRYCKSKTTRELSCEKCK